jgi:hypothetical protein
MSNLSYYLKDDSTVPCPPRAPTRQIAQQAGDFTFACLIVPGSAGLAARAEPYSYFFLYRNKYLMRRIPRCNISVQPYLHLLDDLCGNTISDLGTDIGTGNSN